MQFADAVGDVGQADGQHGHAERLVLIAGVLPAQAEELVAADLELGDVAAEIVLDELRSEHVVAGGNGRVRGEDGAGGDGLAGGVEVDRPCSSISDADALQAAKGTMPLVHVADGRRLAQGAQGHDAADAQHHLLADAHVAVAAVQPGGDGAVLRRVLRDVGVEQIQRHAADLDAPDAARAPRGRGTACGSVIGAPSRLQFRDERQVEEIVFGIAFLLPAIDGEILAEVALAVHQADAHQRQAEIAGALEVIAGQHAEAAGIDGHALVNAELGGEVGDAQVLAQIAAAVAVGGGMVFLKPGRRAHVVVERFLDAVHVSQEAVVVQQLLDAGLDRGRRAA